MTDITSHIIAALERISGTDHLHEWSVRRSGSRWYATAAWETGVVSTPWCASAESAMQSLLGRLLELEDTLTAPSPFTRCQTSSFPAMPPARLAAITSLVERRRQARRGR